MKRLVVVVCVLFGALVSEVGAGSAKLWYDWYAHDWESWALPIGNGRMGCMIFGKVEQERIQFNVDSLWTGDENMVGKERGKSKDVSYLAEGMGYYQNFGDVFVTLNHEGKIKNYRRELDLSCGVNTASYEKGDVNFKRTSFCSYPDQVMVMRMTAGSPGQYSGRIEVKDAHDGQVTAESSVLTFKGALKNGMEYEARLTVVNKGGELKTDDSGIVFSGCDELLLLLAADTDYVMDRSRKWKGEHPHKRLVDWSKKAIERGYDNLLKRHVEDHQALFGRVELNLGKSDPERTALPISKRIWTQHESNGDPELMALLFQYGRYLLIASSRPGSLPANLQGVWNHSNTPAWHCDYHNNINVQMNYWLAESANLSECHLSLFDLCSASVPVWREATLIRFGEIRGFTAQTVNNIFGGCGWEWNMVGSAWIAQHFWEHYDFTLDKKYLSDTAYPFMKQVCFFWEDRLKELPDGSIVVPEGWSPEHGPREDGVMYDQQIVWDLFRNTIEASEVLGVDEDFRASLKDKHKRLVGPRIGRWGQLQEWMRDVDREDDNHRHTSHLFAVYPGRQISRDKTPEFAKAAEVSLRARGETGDARHSWTWAWRCALWARLGDAEMAHRMISGLLQYNTLPNLITKHPPLQLDGSFGITAAMCEMLLQSHAGQIELLPALPSAWPTGYVKGLRARGGFEVDIEWKDGKMVSSSIKSVGGETCRVVYGKNSKTFKLRLGKTAEWDGK